MIAGSVSTREEAALREIPSKNTTSSESSVDNDAHTSVAPSSSDVSHPRFGV
jgi:hypothetical protein